MSDLRYFNLSIPSPQRLALMRAAFDRHPVDYPHCPDYRKPRNWRDIRGWTLRNYAAAFATAGAGSNDGRPVIYWHSGDAPVRKVSDALPSRSRGWNADYNGDQGLIIGIVGSLSHGRFIAGYRWTDNGEHVLFTDEVFDDEDYAIRAADDHARLYAEQCCEHNERFDTMVIAEVLCQEKEKDLCDAWAEYRAAWADRLVSPYALKSAHKAREWVRSVIEDLRASREELAIAQRAYERG